MGDYNRKGLWEMDVVNEDEQELIQKSMVGMRCLVCPYEPHFPRLNDRRAHIQSDRHVNRVRYIMRNRNSRFQRFVEAIQMYKEHDLGRRYIFSPNVKELVCQHVFERETGASSLTRAKRLCVRYRKEEPITLLEMALWRTACVLNPTEADKANMVHFCLCGGWKKHKQTHRNDKMISIVIECVLPFVNLNSVVIIHSS